MKPIKVGLIRCDTHGAYYAALMGRFDPELLKQPLTAGEKGGFSWQIGVIHFLFYKNCYAPDVMSVPAASGFSIEKIWDSSPEIAGCFGRVFKIPQICKTFEEVSDGVDLVFIAECNGEGQDHLKLARPGLMKGVPTFIDKPFAYDIRDAVKLVQLARKKRTPLYSSSILREMPEGVRFRQRLVEIEPLKLGCIMGCGGSFAQEIHSLSLAQNVFGAGVESVECMGPYNMAHILLHYKSNGNVARPDVVVNCLKGRGDWSWKDGLRAVAHGAGGCICSETMSDYEYPAGALSILKKIKRMVKTGQPIVPYDEMLELIAVATAARRAQKGKRSVKISEIWKRKAGVE